MTQTLDTFDLRILDALQRDGAMTNSALAERVHLSASQCSRRRAALEASGIIRGYRAHLNADQLGMGLLAIVRLNMKEHNRASDTQLSHWFRDQPEVQSAYSATGDADYVLMVRLPDLDAFSTFVHDKPMMQPQIAQVRSDLVLRCLKEDAPMDLGFLR